MNVTTQIFLLRHGECEGGEIYRGISDVALTERGWRQMRDALATTTGWNEIIASPLIRCAKFAALLAEELMVPVSIETGFRELDFGDWEGRLTADVWREEPVKAAQFMRDPVSMTPPGGESVNDAYDRVVRGWDEHRERLVGQSVLLVAHGGTIRLLLSSLLRLPLSSINCWHIPYACLTQVNLIHHKSEIRAQLIAHGVAHGNG